MVEPEFDVLPGKALMRTPREGSDSLSMQPIGYVLLCSMTLTVVAQSSYILCVSFSDRITMRPSYECSYFN